MYFINQITQDDCAFTSLKILLANLKNDETYLYLKEDEKHGAYSYLEISDISKKYGVDLVGFKVENKDELKHADSFPMILTINVGDNKHAVCLMSISKNNALILDPSYGKSKMRLEQLLEIWDGTGLLVRECKEECIKPKVPFVKAKNNILDYLFQFVAGALFLFSLFTMGFENFAFYSLISLGLAIAFEILSRIVKVKEMKKFDAKMNDFIENIDPKMFNQFLMRKEKYKESVFSNKNNFIYYLFVSIFLVFTIVLGDPKNVFCVLMPILLAIVETQIFAKKEKDNIKEIEKLEVKFSNSKITLKTNSLYNDIHTKSYKFANLIFFKKAIEICLLGLCAGLSLYFLGNLNLINFLFLLFTEVYLYQNLNSLMSYESGVIERKISYMRFINIFDSEN